MASARDEVVGVIGIGAMGLPIAKTLAAAGREVRVFDVDAGATGRAREAGLVAAASMREVVEGAGVILTVLSGSRELAELVAGPDAPAGMLGAGALWIDLTSSGPDVLERCVRDCQTHGIDFVAAPLRGSVTDADAGTLRFYAAGAADALQRAQAVFEALGGAGAATFVGQKPAEAATVKLLANLLWFGQVAATTEALLLGQALGIEPERLSRILRESPGGSSYLDQHVDALLDGDYLETFALDRVVEELQIVQDHATRTATPFELSTLVLDLHRRAQQRFGAADGELLVAKMLEVEAGRTLRRAKSPEAPTSS